MGKERSELIDILMTLSNHDVDLAGHIKYLFRAVIEQEGEIAKLRAKTWRLERRIDRFEGR